MLLKVCEVGTTYLTHYINKGQELLPEPRESKWYARVITQSCFERILGHKAESDLDTPKF